MLNTYYRADIVQDYFIHFYVFSMTLEVKVYLKIQITAKHRGAWGLGLGLCNGE